jgi:hypothetical protein
MINPKWLESAFIVQNGAIEYDEELSSEHEYHVHETDIKVSPYRKFVGENPDKSTYYQPILDALDYSPSILEHQSNTIMVEGKGDYYVFTYFNEIVFGNKKKLRFLPSSGANDLGPLISLYLGWGYEFTVLLDDDSAGKSAKKRYIDEWYLNDTTIKTLVDLDNNLSRKKLESLLSSEGKKIIKDQLGVQRVTKKQITRFFQDKLASGDKIKFDKETQNNFKMVFKELI